MERDETPPVGRSWATTLVGDRQIEFEWVACNYCGTSDEAELFRGPDRLLHLPGNFRVVRCTGCCLIRQNPRPTAATIDAYYPPDYEPFAGAISEEANPARRLDRWYGMYKRRRLIEACVPGGSLLDVGCATGNFLAELAATGRWRTVGIEPNVGAATRAVQHRLDVRVGRLEDVSLPAESFDVVTLWNVLEHVHEPVDELRRVSRLLKPGGWIIFSIPNLESFEKRLFWDKWLGWDLPRHLYFFPRETLRAILAAHGFTLERSTCLSGSQLSFALSLRCLDDRERPRRSWSRLAAAALASLPARVALSPVFYGLGRLRQATILTIVARKRAA